MMPFSGTHMCHYDQSHARKTVANPRGSHGHAAEDAAEDAADDAADACHIPLGQAPAASWHSKPCSHQQMFGQTCGHNAQIHLPTLSDLMHRPQRPGLPLRRASIVRMERLSQPQETSTATGTCGMLHPSTSLCRLQYPQLIATKPSLLNRSNRSCLSSPLQCHASRISITPQQLHDGIKFGNKSIALLHGHLSSRT
jgi:hypothetical protein